MATCAEYVSRLADAEDALHKLRIGGKVQTISYADKSTSYSAADLQTLERYVCELQNRVDACNGVRRSCRRGRIIRMIPT